MLDFSVRSIRSLPVLHYRSSLMNRFSSRIRFAFVLLAAMVIIVLYLGLSETPNKAQPRTVELPKAKFEQFSRSDEVTSDIRDRSKELIRVDVRSFDDREKVKRYGRIVEDL